MNTILLGTIILVYIFFMTVTRKAFPQDVGAVFGGILGFFVGVFVMMIIKMI